MSKKFQNFDANVSSTTKVFNVTNDGYTFFGDIHQTSNTPENQNVPESSYFGTSLTSGNKVRDLYNFNSHPAIHYEPTSDDKKQIVKKFINYVSENAIVSYFPWLYPIPEIDEWSSNSQTLLENGTFTIYKCLGKGVGQVDFYKCGSAVSGQEDAAGTTNTLLTTTQALTFGTSPSTYLEGPIYPFDGYIYSGTLVQLITEVDEDTGIRETRIIPYQTGRGIPLYSTNYEPSENIALTPFGPFGELQWPSGDTMSPSLATGVTPGESNAAVGIVLDSYSSQPSSRIFPPQDPNGFNVDDISTDHDLYYNKPAPQTSPAVSYIDTNTTPTTQGFLSPGPNLSGTYYSPWPRYYAYQPGEAVPVLTKGVTTARIGAAYNIALMTYGVRQQISPTDESWLPVTCIPLFQGERLEAGSTIYASVKGNIMTPGPYQFNTFDNDEDQQLVVSLGVIGQTPWDPFADSTWSNIGWTGTPGISFANIPDQSNAILEILQDEEGNRKVIQGLNQANQGSIIVQPITTHSPSPAIGNAYLQSQEELDTTGFTPAQVLQTKQDRAALPGISGRCTLPQSVPEKAQPIGIMMETIVGTGKWTYTGLPLDNSDYSGSIVSGGALYGSPTTLGNTPLRTNTLGGGLVMPGEAAWTDFESDPPYLGTITGGVTLPVGGNIAYPNGSIVTVQDDSLTWDTTEFQYHGNNASMTITDSEATITLQTGGTGYTDATAYQTFNLSLNNGYFDFNDNGGGGADIVFIGTLPGSSYFQDFSRYPVNTIIRVLYKTAGGYSTLGYFRINDYLSYTSLSMVVFKASDVYTIAGNTFMETEQSNYNTLIGSPEINVLTTGASGEILTYEFVDYGTGNKAGDRLLLINGTVNPGTDIDNNGVIEFAIPPGYQEIIAMGPNYASSRNPYDTIDLAGVATIATVDVLNDPNPDQNRLPIIFDIDVAIGADEFVRLIYDSTFSYANPRYHSYITTIFATPTDNVPHRGGTNYSTEIKVNTYNLTANSLRVYYTIANEVITGKVAGLPPYNDANFPVITDRYTFDATSGTQVRILYENTPEAFQEIILLESFNLTTGLTASQARAGGVYSLADDNYIFQTQRTDQTNPVVDITVDANDYVRQVKLRDRGTNNQDGDIILVTQTGSDMNCTFIYKDNMPYIDLPPYARVPEYRVKDNDEAWQRYSDIMSSAVNLFDTPVLIELNPSPDQTMENIYPSASVASNRAPPTNDIYREMYGY